MEQSFLKIPTPELEGAPYVKVLHSSVELPVSPILRKQDSGLPVSGMSSPVSFGNGQFRMSQHFWPPNVTPKLNKQRSPNESIATTQQKSTAAASMVNHSKNMSSIMTGKSQSLKKIIRHKDVSQFDLYVYDTMKLNKDLFYKGQSIDYCRPGEIPKKTPRSVKLIRDVLCLSPPEAFERQEKKKTLAEFYGTKSFLDQMKDAKLLITKGVPQVVRKKYGQVLFSKNHGEEEKDFVKKQVRLKENKQEVDWIKLRNEIEEKEALKKFEVFQKNITQDLTYKLGVYNRFYIDFLDEPKDPFSGPRDLQVDLRPLKVKAVTESLVNKKYNLAYTNRTNRTTRTTRTTRREMVSPKSSMRKSRDASPTEKRLRAAEERFNRSMWKMDRAMEMLAQRPMPESELEKKFWTLIKDGDQEVKKFLYQNPRLVHLVDKMNQNPLHWIAKRNFMHLIDIMKEYDADATAQDITGRTPSEVALRFGNIEISNVIKYNFL